MYNSRVEIEIQNKIVTLIFGQYYIRLFNQQELQSFQTKLNTQGFFVWICMRGFTGLVNQFNVMADGSVIILSAYHGNSGFQLYCFSDEDVDNINIAINEACK